MSRLVRQVNGEQPNAAPITGNIFNAYVSIEWDPIIATAAFRLRPARPIRRRHSVDPTVQSSVDQSPITQSSATQSPATQSPVIHLPIALPIRRRRHSTIVDTRNYIAPPDLQASIDCLQRQNKGDFLFFLVFV